MKQKGLAGFTLIELLVVIAIIGILAVVVLINLSSARLKSRDARRISDIDQVRKALELYLDDCHQYPPTLDPSANDGCPGTITFGDYMETIPKDPNGSDYTYTYDDVENTFELGFTLEGQVDQYAAGAHTMTPAGIQ